MDTGRDNLSNIVEHRFGLTKTLHFLYLLRRLGQGVRNVIQLTVPKMSAKQQYIAACVLSYKEIDNSCEDIFNNAWTYLNSGKAKCTYGYISFRRVVVLMNHPVSQTHGEVRLLDPNRDILKEILPHTKEHIHEIGETHLAKMKSDFTDLFGTSEKYVILVFSHLIPCTEPDYMCSKLMGEYVKRSDELVVVAYENCFEYTVTDNALANLGHKNIYVTDITLIQAIIRRKETIIHDFVVEKARRLQLEGFRRLQWEMQFRNYSTVILQNCYSYEAGRRQRNTIRPSVEGWRPHDHVDRWKGIDRMNHNHY